MEDQTKKTEHEEMPFKVGWQMQTDQWYSSSIFECLKFSIIKHFKKGITVLNKWNTQVGILLTIYTQAPTLAIGTVSITKFPNEELDTRVGNQSWLMYP